MDMFLHYFTLSMCWWFFIWTFPFMFFMYRYGIGSDRSKDVDEVIGNLSSDPDKFKIKYWYCIYPHVSSGLFWIYALFYPLVRHRGKNRTLKFDIVMWLNFLFYFDFVTTYPLGKLGYLNYFR